ncbi:hypothetical protein HUU42_00485 [bacterium]|nr:hypothetical protein [bacterium]
MTCEIFTYYKIAPEKEPEYVAASNKLKSFFMEFPDCISYRIYRSLDEERKHTWMEWGEFSSREDFENIIQQVLASDALKQTALCIVGGMEGRKTEIFTEA